MTIQQAAAISKANNLPIRRASWPADKWFWVWLGGHWFSYPSGKPHTALATDYSTADLLATDWTTVPAPLASCPVTPSEPIGGGDPIGGIPGWPDAPDPSFPSPPGVPSGGGGGGPSLPPPKPGTTLSVTFSGLVMDDLGSYMYGVTVGDFNGPHELTPTGAGAWNKKFDKGFYSTSGNDESLADHHFRWIITATRFGSSPVKWHLSLVGSSSTGSGAWPPGGFSEREPQEKGDEMDNDYDSSSFGVIHGGHGVVN